MPEYTPSDAAFWKTWSRPYPGRCARTAIKTKLQKRAKDYKPCSTERCADFDGNGSRTCAFVAGAVDGGHGVPIGVTRPVQTYHDRPGEQQIGS